MSCHAVTRVTPSIPILNISVASQRVGVKFGNTSPTMIVSNTQVYRGGCGQLRGRPDRDCFFQRPEIDVSFVDDAPRRHAFVLVSSAQDAKTSPLHSNTHMVLLYAANAAPRILGVP